MNKLKLTIIFASLLALASCSNQEQMKDSEIEAKTISPEIEKKEEFNVDNELARLEEEETEKEDDEITEEDGTFKTYTGQYVIPDGEEEVEFDVSFGENGEIEAVIAKSDSTNATTLGYIKKFNNWTSKNIVGHSIEEVWAKSVNWASLITQAFIKSVKEEWENTN